MAFLKIFHHRDKFISDLLKIPSLKNLLDYFFNIFRFTNVQIVLFLNVQTLSKSDT